MNKDEKATEKSRLKRTALFVLLSLIGFIIIGIFVGVHIKSNAIPKETIQEFTADQQSGASKVKKDLSAVYSDFSTTTDGEWLISTYTLKASTPQILIASMKADNNYDAAGEKKYMQTILDEMRARGIVPKIKILILDSDGNVVQEHKIQD